MATYRRILVPINGGATSSRALHEALRLADALTRLRLVYVLEEVFLLDTGSHASVDYPELEEAVQLSGKQALAQAAEKVRQAGVTPETAALESNGKRTATVIGNEAGQWNADLIVIGTHGRSGLIRLLLGCVAEEVARSASVPVLLVRPHIT